MHKRNALHGITAQQGAWLLSSVSFRCREDCTVVTALHFTTLHCTTLHCIKTDCSYYNQRGVRGVVQLPYRVTDLITTWSGTISTLHPTLQFTALCQTKLHCTTLHCTTLIYIQLNHANLCRTASYAILLKYTKHFNVPMTKPFLYTLYTQHVYI